MEIKVEAPYMKTTETINEIRIKVICALIPSVMLSVIIFGFKPVISYVICVLACALTETMLDFFVLKTNKFDFDSILIGLILSLTIPPYCPVYIAAFGGLFAIIIKKLLLERFCKKLFNVSALVRAIMFIVFGSLFKTFTPSVLTDFSSAKESYIKMFFGVGGGYICACSVIAVVLGGIILTALKIINPLVPILFMGSFSLMSFCLGNDGFAMLLSGAIPFAAVFIATDCATSPLTLKGKAVFAITGGILTALIQILLPYSDAVFFAIIVINLLVRPIDKYIHTKPFGVLK